ncbi:MULTISPECIES: TerB family tellurite resistance protein [Roseomonadaceae]|uniref:TerB family tellurite resistance protein n=1 Tax=Falsiroseomonas oleicola TaxID=2801474 RepID=A0ABS6HDY9_9PROT|nr:TerB family tellurite resistance protein [Roseomonas oleicola]MBU8546561.1 TerB family tellurite resistance protein [Roseomonas oleicola]
MSIWGKLLGGVAGFVTGGPLGAVMGAALGHAADQGPGGRIGPGAADMAALLGNRETLFAISVIVLSAKLAKADGPVQRTEIDAFKAMFRIPPENLRQVAQMFDEARRDAGGWETFAERLGEAFADNRGMLEDVLNALFYIARADGPMTKGELRMLQGVHLRFGLDEAAWNRAKGGQGGAAQRQVEEIDAYAILGLPSTATNEEVRLAWRKLMRENHPDSLASRGVPAEFVDRATRKVAEINAAWDRIKRQRGL